MAADVTLFEDVAEMLSRRHVFETRRGFNVRVTSEGFGVAGVAAPRGISRTGDGPGVLFLTGDKKEGEEELRI
jgi:hypothetical protein